MGDNSSNPAPDSVTAEQLNNAETRRLLDTIDGLRDLHIGGIVDLPQIIVVGDQCSGKSSVLEAISRVHFPVGDNICTRFPTELVLRRAPKDSTDLRIRFASKSPAAGKNEGSSRTRTPFQESGFHRSELPAIINRAKEHISLGDGKTAGFSRDVLRVEIAGPDIPSLTLVDLPGVFYAGASSQPEEWKPVVDDMVEGYMKQRNSIILMVVSADISLSKHAILDKVTKYDIAKERTIGVITKVDLCAGSNLEDEYLRLARGQEPNHQLCLGWHILRNRGPKEAEVDFDQRDAEEERFLNTAAWPSLPSACRGVDSLRKSLGETLLKHIKGSLPEIIQDTDKNLQNRQKRLAKLGTARTNPNEMRDYLLNISMSFHRLAEHAVEGRYNDPFFASPTVQETSRIKFRKLRALLRNLNRAFDITMRTKGARYEIEWELEDSGGTRHGSEAEEHRASGIADVPDYLQPFLRLYDFPDPTPKSESDLIMQLFRDQSEPWRRIAECHLDIVVERTRLFVYHLLDYVLEDDKRTRDAILAECVDPTFKSITETLQSKLEEILRPFTSGHGLPLEWEFRKGLSKRKISRMTTQIVNLLGQRDSVTYNTSSYQILKHEDVRSIILEANSPTTSDFGTDVVIDMMLTHYDMSLRTFTDNVIHLVIENCLVSNLPNIFSTKVVTKMNDEILKRLAEESDEAKLERSQLNDEIEKLKLGLQNCQRSRPRDLSELPDHFTELAPRKDASTKPKPRVRLPFVQYAKPAQQESPFAQLASAKIDFTTGIKHTQDTFTLIEKAPITGVNVGTSLKSDDGKIVTESEPSVFVSSKSRQPTVAESSKNNQTPVADSSSSGQSSVPEPNKTGQSLFAGSSINSSPAAGSLFASVPAPQSKSSIFGSTTATTTAASAFGSAPKPFFGSTATSTANGATFGAVPSTATGVAFGSQPPTKQTFGSTTASITSKSAFGSTLASTITTTAFGSVPASPAPAPKLSAFGSTTASAVTGIAFGSASLSQPPVSITSHFGAAAQSKPSPEPSISTFGSFPTTSTTTSTMTSATPKPPSSGTGLFGVPAVSPPPQSGGLFAVAKSPSPQPNIGSSSA
ncbi:hypothetical protein V8C37DRAFT_414705 [Trichoderma ceciliae]